MSSDRSEFPRRRFQQWDQRRESHRGSSRDAFRTHGAEGHRHSPQRRDSRDRDHRSPLRRPAASPGWDVSEKRRPRPSGDGQSEDGRRCERHKRTRRPSEDGSPRRDVESRRSPHDPGPWRRPADSENQQRDDGPTFRRWSAGYRKQDGPPEPNPEIPVKPPRVPDGPPTPQEDFVCSADLWHGGPSQRPHDGAVNTQRAKSPKPEQMNGFQRFLDILNRGVNVDTLTKIVTQSSTDHFHQTPNLLPRSVDPGTSTDLGPQDNGKSSGRRSLGLMRGRQSQDQVQLQEKTTSTSEDQNKCRQVHDVLQAIGMDLGLEELGQMSSRIKERLYGKKDRDPGHRVSVETGSRPPNSPRPRSGSSSSRSSFTVVPQDGVTKQDLLSTARQQTLKTQKGRCSEYHLELWHQQDQYHRDSGPQQDQYHRDSGPQQDQYHRDSGPQQDQYHRDSGPQQDQYHRDSGPQQDQYRKNCGSLQVESCDSVSPRLKAAPFTYVPAEPPPPPSVYPPPPVLPLHPPAALFPPLPSSSSALLPHLAPGMFLPQRLPPFLSAALGQPAPPPADPLLPDPLPLGPMLLNPTRVKALPRQRCLQVIQTKPG